jgi:hypothetical protein
MSGSILLGAGVAGGFLAAVAGNSGNDLSTGFVRGISVGVASLAIGVSGIALLARRRAVKKERQRLQAIVGPSFLGVVSNGTGQGPMSPSAADLPGSARVALLECAQHKRTR